MQPLQGCQVIYATQGIAFGSSLGYCWIPVRDHSCWTMLEMGRRGFAIPACWISGSPDPPSIPFVFFEWVFRKLRIWRSGVAEKFTM